MAEELHVVSQTSLTTPPTNIPTLIASRLPHSPPQMMHLNLINNAQVKQIVLGGWGYSNHDLIPMQT
jgi:hypothetical protein